MYDNYGEEALKEGGGGGGGFHDPFDIFAQFFNSGSGKKAWFFSLLFRNAQVFQILTSFFLLVLCVWLGWGIPHSYQVDDLDRGEVKMSSILFGCRWRTCTARTSKSSLCVEMSSARNAVERGRRVENQPPANPVMAQA